MSRPSSIRWIAVVLSVSIAGAPAQASPTPPSAAAELRQEILAGIGPTVANVARMAADLPAAKDLAELQEQIARLLRAPKITGFYQAANDRLNQAARVRALRGPFETPNFGEVAPGIFRSANPTLAQAEQLLASRRVDYIIALNPELSATARLDPGMATLLNDDRRSSIRTKLLAQGKSEERAASLLKFYEDHLTYAQAVMRQTLGALELRSLDDPAQSIERYFEVLERIRVLRKVEGRKVLFHGAAGKHRAGMIAMLVKALERGRPLGEQELNELYVEFVERSWNERPETRIQYMIALPLILKSVPFRKLAANWNERQAHSVAAQPAVAR